MSNRCISVARTMVASCSANDEPTQVRWAGAKRQIGEARDFCLRGRQKTRGIEGVGMIPEL